MKGTKIVRDGEEEKGRIVKRIKRGNRKYREWKTGK